MRNMLVPDAATVSMLSLKSQLKSSLGNGLERATKCSMKSAFIERNILKKGQGILN